MLARLEEAFVRLSSFSSDIAHELRTPVSNLMTQTQVALSRARSADDYRGILESNAEEFEHMARMISDMLLLAKADNGLWCCRTARPSHLANEVRALFDYYDAVADEKGFLVLEGEADVSCRPADAAPRAGQPAVQRHSPCHATTAACECASTTRPTPFEIAR